MTIKMKDFTIESCKSKKPLGVTINSNFSFDNHKSKDSSLSRVASNIFDKKQTF